MIARELVTKLSFLVDWKGIENFNRAIKGIKTRIGVFTSSVGLFFAGIVKAASSILDTSDIAKSLGETASEVNSLIKSLSTFRIPTQTSETALRKIGQSVIEARQGFGELFELSRRGFIEIRDEAGKMLSPMKIFLNILEAIGKVEDETYRRALARDFLGDDRFSDVSRSIQELEALRSQFALTSNSMDSTLKDAEEFSKNWILLMQETSELTRFAFTPLIKFFAEALKDLNSLITIIRGGNLKQTFSLAFDNFKNNPMEFWRSFFEKPIFDDLGDLRPFQRETNIRNNINITVPAGTEQQQIDFIRTGADEAFNESFEKGFERIGTNFPRTE